MTLLKDMASSQNGLRQHASYWDFYPAEDSNYNLNGVDGQKEIDGFQNSLALLLRAGIVQGHSVFIRATGIFIAATGTAAVTC